MKKMNLITALEEAARVLKKNHYYPETTISQDGSGSRMLVGGREVVNFECNNFLGISSSPEVIEEMVKELWQSGTGSGSAKTLISHQAQVELEKRMAQFKGWEDFVVVTAGMLANFGNIPALCSTTLGHLLAGLHDNPYAGLKVAIFYDKDCHSCIYDGIALAEHNLWGGKPAQAFRYRHNDMDHLRELLEADGSQLKMIATDGVFSVDGGLAPLAELLALAESYDAVLYVDDAHGTFAMGATGKGTAEELGVIYPNGRVITSCTFSKATAASGGGTGGSKEFCDGLRVASRTHLFQTGIPPYQARGIIEAINVAENETWRRDALRTNYSYLRTKIQQLGFCTCGSNHHIIPVLIGDERKTLQIAHELKEVHGVHTGAFVSPARSLGSGVLRCNAMATHTMDDNDRLLEGLRVLGKKHGLI